MKFIGVDLGWKSQPSGLCCLQLIQGKLELVDLERQDTIAKILTWIDNWVKPAESALIAVDAPTLIPDGIFLVWWCKRHYEFAQWYQVGNYTKLRQKQSLLLLLMRDIQ